MIFMNQQNQYFPLFAILTVFLSLFLFFCSILIHRKDIKNQTLKKHIFSFFIVLLISAQLYINIEIINQLLNFIKITS
jgi:hypothetical protein